MQQIRMKFQVGAALFLTTGASAFVTPSNNHASSALYSEAAPPAPETPAPETPAPETPAPETPAPETPAPAVKATESTSLADLKGLAKDLNPLVNYYDPLNLVDLDILDMGQDATIGFLRHAEIKHGRVAMAAFVGYCVQSNWHFPFAQTLNGDSFPSIDLSPEQQWDAIPALAKWQIITAIGALEIWDEFSGGEWDESSVGEGSHYMKGRQPGKYPPFTFLRQRGNFVLDLYDPFGFNKNMKQETKDRRLMAEINNGRLAMLGIFGFLSADTIEGSVPLLKDIAIPYDGQVMSPFEVGY